MLCLLQDDHTMLYSCTIHIYILYTYIYVYIIYIYEDQIDPFDLFLAQKWAPKHHDQGTSKTPQAVIKSSVEVGHRSSIFTQAKWPS